MYCNNVNKLYFLYSYNLFLCAKKYNILHRVYYDVKIFYHILINNLLIKEFITKRDSYLLFNNKFDMLFINFSDLFKNFLKFVICKKKIFLLQYLCIYYITMYKEYFNIIDVFIYTRYRIDYDINNLIIQKLEGWFGYNNYHIYNIIKDNIIGGFLLYIGNIKLDMTINHKIHQLLTVLKR
jgi:F0F1-type ATP synthase delta subunit